MCQLDTLKRLRPDISTIRAALSNLPKTLDETYERIFLTIPVDDWLSVQHVFQWLVYHNDLFGNNIPLSTLLQAVQQSTASFLSHDANQLHDLEDLRERCGCLIMVEQEETLGYRKKTVCHQRSTVSFAHYTVKEYLQSSRISQKEVGFFAIAQEKFQKHFAGIAFRQALAIQPDILGEYDEAEDTGFIHGLLDADFKLYCGVSSVLQLYFWPKAISSDSSLMEFSEALVDPNRPAYLGFENLLHFIGQGDLFLDRDLFPEDQFWGITWRQKPDLDAAVLLSFLVTSGDSSKTPHLALAFIKTHSMPTILTQQLHITKELLYVFDLSFRNRYDFVGSIPEIIAQWASRQPGAFDFVLDLISEYGAIHFDLSKILLLYVHCHQSCFCEESCCLKRLLRLGASANGPKGAFVTPLQIAVACWDFNGVEMLLNAGAEPNEIGQNGSGWSQSLFMERYNHLHGASSLHIIKHFECNFKGELKSDLNLDETIRERIETRLFESGAVDIEPDSSEPRRDVSD